MAYFSLKCEFWDNLLSIYQELIVLTLLPPGHGSGLSMKLLNAVHVCVFLLWIVHTF